jgi:hypothetical protein
MKNQKIDNSIELLRKSWEIYKENFKTFCGIMSVPFLCMLSFAVISVPLGLFSLFVKSLSLGTYTWTSLLGNTALFITLFFVCLLLIGAWSQIALIYAIGERKKKTSIKESFLATKDKIFSSLWISFLVGLCVFFGFLLLFIPGVIFLIWFYFAHYILVADGVKGTKALSQSRKLTRGKETDVFLKLITILIVIFLVSALFNSFSEKLAFSFFFQNAFNFIVSPFPVIYFFLIYKQLKGKGSD